MGYQLIFEDTFDQKTLNRNIWTPETGGHGYGNKEAQYYTDRDTNIDLSEGYLQIKAQKESFQGNAYTSAKLITYPNQLLQYGKIEVEAIMPRGHGTWPAIWMLGQNFKEGTRWPLCGEIDLLEHVGHNPGKIHFSLHTKNKNFSVGTQHTYVTTIDQPFEKKRTYGIIWKPGIITFTLDGEDVATYEKKVNDTVEDWPFDQPFYLILNVALGGSWGGPIDDEALPTTMKVFRVSYYKET